MELAVNFCVLHPGLLGHVWPRVTPFLEAAMQYPIGEPEMSIEDARHRVETGAIHLIYAKREDGDIAGAALIEFIRYARFTAAHILMLGGRNVLGDPWLREQFRQWAASHNATKVQAVFREEVSRAFQVYGFTETAVFGRGDM